jgi:hypothetical protein
LARSISTPIRIILIGNTSMNLNKKLLLQFKPNHIKLYPKQNKKLIIKIDLGNIYIETTKH